MDEHSCVQHYSSSASARRNIPIRIIIGIVLFNEGADYTAFLYELNDADGNGTAHEWTNLLEETVSNIAFDNLNNFGISVALSDYYAVIGDNGYSSSNDGSGNVWLYNLSDSTWIDVSAEEENVPAVSPGDSFGVGVAISNTHILVDANGVAIDEMANTGQAYLFTLNTGSDNSIDITDITSVAVMVITKDGGVDMGLTGLTKARRTITMLMIAMPMSILTTMTMLKTTIQIKVVLMKAMLLKNPLLNEIPLPLRRVGY